MGFEETFVDRNVNGAFDLNNTPSAPSDSSLPSGLFNGVLCRPSAKGMGVTDGMPIMTSHAETGVWNSRELVNVIDQQEPCEFLLIASNFDIMVINSSEREPFSFLGDQFYTVYVSDIFNNPPPKQSL